MSTAQDATVPHVPRLLPIHERAGVRPPLAAQLKAVEVAGTISTIPSSGSRGAKRPAAVVGIIPMEVL